MADNQQGKHPPIKINRMFYLIHESNFSLDTTVKKLKISIKMFSLNFAELGMRG